MTFLRMSRFVRAGSVTWKGEKDSAALRMLSDMLEKETAEERVAVANAVSMSIQDFSVNRSSGS